MTQTKSPSLVDEYDFTVDGIEFRAKPLKVRDALRGELIAAEVILPLVAAGEGFTFSPEALGALPRVGELVDLMIPSCRVRWSGAWIDLTNLVDTVFARKPAALIAWLFECVGYQYADFFGGNGRDLIRVTASRLASQIGLTGEFGESPPTAG